MAPPTPDLTPASTIQRAAPRTEPRPARRPVGRARLLVAAPVAAAWAAGVSFLPVFGLVVLGAAGSGSSSGPAFRLSLSIWLLGHGVPLVTPDQRVSLVPLAITTLAAWRIARAGLHAGRAIGAHRHRTVRPAAAAAAAVALPYAGLGWVAGSFARTPAIAVSPTRAALTLGAFALAVATLGALAGHGGLRERVAALPVPAVDAVRTGIIAVLLVLAAGAATAGVALALRGPEATDLLGSYRAGVLGQAGITVVCLAYAPNLAVWTASYLLGPGFAVGAGTLVSPGAVTVGPLPALPVLAGLPSGPATGFAAALIAVPVLAALAAGWLLARRRMRGAAGVDWSGLLVAAAGSGPVAGLLMALAALVSGGGLGTGRLAILGPVSWRVGLFTAGAVAIGALLGTGVGRVLRAQRP